jgi:hypothetical protein
VQHDGSMLPPMPSQRFARLGPYLRLDVDGPWLDVCAVTMVDETKTPDGGRRVVLGDPGLALACAGPVHEVVTALTHATQDWARERARAEEQGRLETVDGCPPPTVEESPWP